MNPVKYQQIKIWKSFFDDTATYSFTSRIGDEKAIGRGRMRTNEQIGWVVSPPFPQKQHDDSASTMVQQEQIRCSCVPEVSRDDGVDQQQGGRSMRSPFYGLGHVCRAVCIGGVARCGAAPARDCMQRCRLAGSVACARDEEREAFFPLDARQGKKIALNNTRRDGQLCCLEAKQMADAKLNKSHMVMSSSTRNIEDAKYTDLRYI